MKVLNFTPNFKGPPPCLRGMSTTHKRRTSQTARENAASPYVNHKYKRFLCSGEREKTRPAEQPVFSLKRFCLSFEFLQVGNNSPSRWARAALLEEHYLNVVVLSGNTWQHKVTEDLPVVLNEILKRIFFPDHGRLHMSGY